MARRADMSFRMLGVPDLPTEFSYVRNHLASRIQSSDLFIMREVTINCPSDLALSPGTPHFAWLVIHSQYSSALDASLATRLWRDLDDEFAPEHKLVDFVAWCSTSTFSLLRRSTGYCEIGLL